MLTYVYSVSSSTDTVLLALAYAGSSFRISILVSSSFVDVVKILKDVPSFLGFLLYDNFDLFLTQTIIHATISRHVHTRIIHTTATIIPPTTRNVALGRVAGVRGIGK